MTTTEAEPEIATKRIYVGTSMEWMIYRKNIRNSSFWPFPLLD